MAITITQTDANSYVQVVNDAAGYSLIPKLEKANKNFLWEYDDEIEPKGYSNGFSFSTHLHLMTEAACWDAKQKKYTDVAKAAKCFREYFLDRIDAKRFPDLLQAAVMLDNPDLTEQVLQAVPKIDGQPIVLEPFAIVVFASDNTKTKAEAVLRKHFHFPARAPTAAASVSAAAKSMPRTLQDLAADFAKQAEANVTLRANLIAEFMKLPEDFRNQVYGALYQIKPPANAQQNVPNYGELAFLHQGGLSSTGQEKSKAILAVLGANAKK